MSQETLKIICPGCGQEYDLVVLSHSNYIEKPKNDDPQSKLFSFRCFSKKMVGSLECKYEFHIFDASKPQGREESWNEQDKVWSLFQKKRFNPKNGKYWVVVYWQEKIDRYQPKILSDLLNLGSLKYLINGFMFQVGMPFSVTEWHDDKGRAICLAPSEKDLENVMPGMCFENFKSGRCTHDRESAIRDLKYDKTRIFPQFRLCSSGNLIWLYPLRVGTEYVGMISACGISFKVGSYSGKPSGGQDRWVSLINEMWSDNAELFKRKIRELKDLRFILHSKINNNREVGISEFHKMCCDVKQIASEIKEWARGSYDRRRRLNENLLLREIISRIERRYASNYDAADLWMRFQGAISRVAEFLGISKIMYFHNIYLHKTLYLKVDSDGAYSDFDEMKNVEFQGPEHIDYMAGDKSELTIEMLTDFRRLMTSKQPYFFKPELRLPGEGPYHFDLDEAGRAVQRSLADGGMNGYEILCLAPVSVGHLGPSSRGLLVFLAKIGDKYIAHRDLYWRIIAVLSLLIRHNYAHKERRITYAASDHGIPQLLDKLGLTIESIAQVVEEKSIGIDAEIDWGNDEYAVKPYDAKYPNTLHGRLFALRAMSVDFQRRFLKRGANVIAWEDRIIKNVVGAKKLFGKMIQDVRIADLVPRIRELQAFLSRLNCLDFKIDGGMIEHAFIESFENVRKYSIPNSGIYLIYELCDAGDDGAFHQISLSNMSFPIKKDEEDWIFYPNCRGSNIKKLGQTIKGGGLGLFLIREILVAHGGYCRLRQMQVPSHEARTHKGKNTALIVFDYGIPV